MTPADLNASSAVALAWLLTYAIHSTILLGAAVILARRFADEHAWLDRLWKTALIGPIITASVQVGSGVTPLSGRWSIAPATPVVASPATTFATAAETLPTPEQAIGVSSPPADKREMERTRPQSAAATEAGAWQRVFAAWPLIAVLSWLAIAALGLTRFGWRLMRVHRVLGNGPPVTDPHLRETIETLCGGRNRSRLRLTTSGICAVPLALAGGRIVLPERFLQQLDTEEQRVALAHELAHVVRRDPAWRILAGALERAFFFQPLNRVAHARLSESAEFLCDHWAVQHTSSPLALARCLAVVARWASPASDDLAVEVSAMARSDSAMVRRVTRILNAPTRPSAGPSILWLAIPLSIVAVGAPLVTAAQLTGPATPSRVWTEPELAQARARLRVHTPLRPADPLEERWRWALADARRRGLSDFWIAYSFQTPTHAQDLMMSDTRDGSFWSDGRFTTTGPPITDLLSAAGPASGMGNLVALFHYRGGRADAIDRAAYRSARLGFEFGGTPVFWLGDAVESESFGRVRGLFEQARNERIQTLLIGLASLHPTTDLVLPFLTRLVEPSNPVAIRREAAEGFAHHHDPRSVDVLLRVARTDTVSEVRAEAAEAIGEVQTPQSIPALNELVNSPDAAVRSEAAEAFGDQPAERALPAIDDVIRTNVHQEVLAEAVEALGEIDDSSAVAALVRIVWEHTDAAVQREAVETLGDRDNADTMPALERILREHPREDVQAEAIETLTDLSGDSLHPQIVAVALSGRNPRLRRDALDAIADVASETSNTGTLDTAQQAIESVIFNDADESVQNEALDALSELPEDRALRVLRDVVERHPDPRIRREAREQQRDRRRR